MSWTGSDSRSIEAALAQRAQLTHGEVIMTREGHAVSTYAVAFLPDGNLVAVTDAPPTIGAAPKFADDTAAIYYPFTDLLLPDQGSIRELLEALVIHRPSPPS